MRMCYVAQFGKYITLILSSCPLEIQPLNLSFTYIWEHLFEVLLTATSSTDKHSNITRMQLTSYDAFTTSLPLTFH